MKWAPLVVVAVLGCAGADRESNPAETPRSDSSVAVPDTLAGSSNAPAREIYIDSVVAANPLLVHGRARTFENVVQVRVRDSGGTVLAETHTMSAGEMGHHNPFSASLWLTRLPGDRVVVEAFEYSAKDGSVRSLVADTVPVRLESRQALLVFPTSDCTRTAEFRRNVPQTLSVARLLVEALVAGPDSAEKAAGASHPFPAGSAVNSVVLRQDELTVDFNDRLQNVGGACAAQSIRAAVTGTLGHLPSVRRVVITAGGSRELALQP